MYLAEHWAIPGRREACAPLARENRLEVCWSKTQKLWLLNNTVNNITLEPGELMGFNVGSWCELAGGRTNGES